MMTVNTTVWMMMKLERLDDAAAEHTIVSIENC
jgi:hypothetical protein